MVIYINYLKKKQCFIFYYFKRFKIKYHPDDSIKRKEEQTIALKVSSNKKQYFKFILLNI